MLKKFTNKKGFTLIEMLIVVAIIAVLIAIAIPTFAGQIEKANQATDAANIRAAYAEAALEAIESGTAVGDATTVEMVHTGTFDKIENPQIGGTSIKDTAVTKGHTVTVAIAANGTVTVTPN